MQLLPNLLEGRRGLVVGIAHFDALIDQAPARAFLELQFFVANCRCAKSFYRLHQRFLLSNDVR